MICCDKEFIGRTIKNIRKKAAIKQCVLAEKIGISEKHLSKIETGKNMPSLENFLKMADALSFTLEDFGIKAEKHENQYRNTLLKTAYSASDKELKSYCKIIETLNNILSDYSER